MRAEPVVTMPATTRAVQVLDDLRERLLNAGTVQVEARVELSGPPRLTMTTSLILGAGGRRKLSFDAMQDGVQFKLADVSDGKRTATFVNGGLHNNHERVEPPEKILAWLTRAPLVPSASIEYSDKPRPPFDPDRDWPVEALSVQPAADGAEPTVFTYTLRGPSFPEGAHVELTLDPKTRLPATRTASLTRAGKDLTITETFIGWKLGEKLDDAIFAIPAK